MSIFDTIFDFLTGPAITIVIMPPRSIGGIYANVTIDESGTDTLEITQHPVQSGATITDHAYKKPAEVAIKAMWNDQEMPLEDIYQQLLDLQASLEPFTVVTGKRSYDNMLFKTLSVNTDKTTENCLAINAIFQEIIIVEVTTATVAPTANQANPQTTDATQNAGTKTAQTTDPSTPPVPQSVANQWFGEVSTPQ